MSVLKTILKIAVPTPDIESYDRFLFVGPHPDDIEIGCGATIAKLADLNKKITFLICTDGRYGDGSTNLRGEDLAKKRMEESVNSAKLLGVNDIRFLNLCDGGFYNVDELKQKIARTISDVNPEVIFAPDPSVTSECHTDHLNVGDAVKKLACFAPYEEIMKNMGCERADVKAVAFYYTAKPNKYVKTTGYLEKQLKAIFENHLTQFPKDGEDAKAITTYLKLRGYDYGIRNFCKTAEGYRMLTKMQMHCLSEYGD